LKTAVRTDVQSLDDDHTEHESHKALTAKSQESDQEIFQFGVNFERAQAAKRQEQFLHPPLDSVIIGMAKLVIMKRKLTDNVNMQKAMSLARLLLKLHLITSCNLNRNLELNLPPQKNREYRVM
jgi:hypothetical protein